MRLLRRLFSYWETTDRWLLNVWSVCYQTCLLIEVHVEMLLHSVPDYDAQIQKKVR